MNVGDRVFVFDHLLYKNDKDTPLSVTMKPATVLLQYTHYYYFRSWDGTVYEWVNELIAIRFDHRSEEVTSVFEHAIMTPQQRFLIALLMIVGQDRNF